MKRLTSKVSARKKADPSMIFGGKELTIQVSYFFEQMLSQIDTTSYLNLAQKELNS